MNIKNKFINLDFLSEENIKKSKKILKQTFLIDFDDFCKKYEDDIIEDTLNFTFDNDGILMKLHEICMYILKDYKISIKEYFPSIDNENNLQVILENYILHNIELNLALYNDYCIGSNKEHISLDESINEYSKINEHINFTIREKLRKGETLDSADKSDSTITKFKNNIKSNLDNIAKDNSNILNLYSLYKNFENEDKEILSITSNVLMYSLDYWYACKYSKKNNNYNYKYKDMMEFLKGFLENELTIKDLYSFEEIYSIYFSLSCYFFDYYYNINNLDNNQKTAIIECLFPILQLPNSLGCSEFISIAMQIYIYEEMGNKIDEFKKGIENICLDLRVYFIPLYNMVFSNILKYYCDNNDIKIEKFLENHFKENKILDKYREGYECLLERGYNFIDKNTLNRKDDGSLNDKFLKEFNKNREKEFTEKEIEKELEKYYVKKPTEKEIEKDDLFIELNQIITEKFNLDIFENDNLINWIGTFNKQLSLRTEDREKYQKSMKEFILSIKLKNNNCYKER